MSAEEAAALASRMRVQARLPRIASVGSILGFLCGAFTLWPFLISTDFVVRAMVTGGITGWTAVLTPLVACGLLLWLAFYSLRLQFQSGSTTTGTIEDNLRKIRAILASCMTLSIVAVCIALSGPLIANLGTAALYTLSAVVCGVIVGDVRKGLGEFETDDERKRRRMARGFAVELKPISATVAAIPLAAPALPVPAIATSEPISLIPPPLPVELSGPPPLATIAPVPVVPLPNLLSADQQADRDLRMLLHLVAVMGIVVYVLRLPEFFGIVEQAFRATTAVPPPRRFNPAPANLSVSFFSIEGLELYGTRVVIGLLGFMWIAWGILVLNFGARLRVVAYTMAWATAACLTVQMLLSFVPLIVTPSTAFPGNRQYALMPMQLFWRMPEIFHVLFLLALLSRPSVKALFFQRSEVGG